MATTMELQPRAIEPDEITSMVNLDVVSQHAEDAQFLFSQRRRAICAPRYRLRDLFRLDERLEASIDGLFTAGEAAWGFAREALESGSEAGIFAGASFLILSGDDDRIRKTLETCQGAQALLNGLIAALGFARIETAQPHIKRLLRSDLAGATDVAFQALAVHRVDPGEALRNAALSTNPHLNGTACELIGLLGRTDLTHLLLRGIGEVRNVEKNDEATRARFYGAWAAARLGDRRWDTVAALRQYAEGDSPYSEKAADILVRIMEPSETREWIEKLLRRGRKRRLAVVSMMGFGDPHWIMQNAYLFSREDTARIAGAAFSRVTGIDLAEAGLDQPKPDKFDAGLNEDPNDPYVAMDEDESLPWPSEGLIQAWWSRESYRFDMRNRYLCGLLITDETLAMTLRNGYQPERASAALELALSHPARPMFPVHAHARRQYELLALVDQEQRSHRR